MIDLKKLLENGVHFGHQTARWCPRMKPYIWGSKSGIYLIDVSKTATQLEKAANFLESVIADGKTILWVGTKKAAQGAIERVGKELNLPYVIHRWVGGTFSNYRQVRKSVAKLLHYEDIIAKSDQFPYSKKELNVIQKKIDRLIKNVGGIRQLTWPVGAVVIVDVKKEHVCLKEAETSQIPVVALVDTNSDPSLVDYVIPANDDVPRSINVLIEYLAESVKKAQAVHAAKPKSEVEDLLSLKDDAMIGLDGEDEESAEKKKNAKPTKRPIVNARLNKRPSDSGSRHKATIKGKVDAE